MSSPSSLFLDAVARSDRLTTMRILRSHSLSLDVVDTAVNLATQHRNYDLAEEITIVYTGTDDDSKLLLLAARCGDASAVKRLVKRLLSSCSPSEERKREVIDEMSLQGCLEDVLDVWPDACKMVSQECISRHETFESCKDDIEDTDTLSVIAQNAAAIDCVEMFYTHDFPKDAVVRSCVIAAQCGSCAVFVRLVENYPEYQTEITDAVMKEMGKSVSSCPPSEEVCLYPIWKYNEEIHMTLHELTSDKDGLDRLYGQCLLLSRDAESFDRAIDGLLKRDKVFHTCATAMGGDTRAEYLDCIR
jgi:hypothetical protein